MAFLKSFEAVLYSDKVEYKGIFLRPLPPKDHFFKCRNFFVEIFEENLGGV